MFGYEIISRRIQVILQAYHSNPGRPSFDHAPHYNPLGNPFDGVVPELRKQGVQKVTDEDEVERTRQKASELRQEADKFRYKGNGAADEGGGDDKAAPGGKPKGKGHGGRGNK